MPNRIDYYFNEDWDIEFTDWDDFRTVTGTKSLTQNFVLLASDYTSELVGTSLTATKLSRHRQRLESQFSSKAPVDYFSIDNIDVDEDVVKYDLTIGSDEYTQKIYV